MSAKRTTTVPDETAVRVALWRALHVQADAPPHVIEDEIGLELVAPGDDWRLRGDMAGDGMSGFRAGVVARARFIEDLVTEQCADGVPQYVILGAGLDTFVQRRPEFAGRLRVFEIEQPATQEWKRRRLAELGRDIPEWQRFVPVDFETGEVWWDRLVENGFDPAVPAVFSCAGVTMYLSKDAVADTLAQAARAASGSTLAMTFILPTAFDEPEDPAEHEAAGRPKPGPRVHFRSYFTPDEILGLAGKAGFREARYVSTEEITERYFAGRADDFRPAAGEPFMLATT
ncbi:class I SAM-dependent methyltransferase [Streptomyces albus]|uniref:class I SAM-dependent methyltransferase n=1 Tax=Streptomyces TaxID=1883 RepID=UPI00034E2D1D|nr:MULTISPECIES: class I SAM-dependent methyltransferase [Streptomyces]EPD96984.1 TIGR00027 family methyltransferase [Streptomyces sp. HPH0547]KPC94827.1 methyltransferase [Streptomyces sp. NRRL F-6602]UVN58448.1 class I SAM-dependent methyltransferase [Streptomyces albus]